jgi:hypothetical protein
LSAPPAESTSAWKATESARCPWSAPWPACQARHSPARAAAVASGPTADSRPWASVDPACAVPPMLATAAWPRPYAAASAPVVAGTWSATGDARPGSSPVAAAATPPTDSTATSAAAAAFIVNTLWGTAVLRGTKVGACVRLTEANSAIASCSPASSSGAAGAVAAASSLASPP